MRLFSPEKLAEGISPSSPRAGGAPAPTSLDPCVKSLNYLNNALAKLEARQRGADEALLLNARGTVAEASVANVFAVRDGRLATPPAHRRRAAGHHAPDGARARARARRPGGASAASAASDLLGADEVFLTGTGARIVPVASLDGRRIGTLSRGRSPSASARPSTRARGARARPSSERETVR